MPNRLGKDIGPAFASAPSSPSPGQKYYNTVDGNYYVWDGVASAWVDLTVQGGGSVDIKQTEVDFGSTPTYQKTFTVTDASVTGTSQITGTVAYEAPTGRQQDDIEMDPLTLNFAPGSGSFTVLVKAIEGRVYGKYKINYLVG